MITDGCCYRKALQCISTQIGSIFFFLGLTGFVYLVTCGDNKVNIRVFRKSSIESTIPGKTIVLCSGISFTGFVCQFGTILSLTFGSTNLWVTYIEDFYGICFLCFIFAHVCLLTVFLYCVVVGCLWFKSGYSYVIIFICFVAGKSLVYITGSTLEGFKLVFVGSEMDNRSSSTVTFFAVPCKVKLCVICTRSERYFGKICCGICPAGSPVRPSGISTGNTAVCVVFCGCINGRTYSCNGTKS